MIILRVETSPSDHIYSRWYYYRMLPTPAPPFLFSMHPHDTLRKEKLEFLQIQSIPSPYPLLLGFVRSSPIVWLDRRSRLVQLAVYSPLKRDPSHISIAAAYRLSPDRIFPPLLFWLPHLPISALFEFSAVSALNCSTLPFAFLSPTPSCAHCRLLDLYTQKYADPRQRQPRAPGRLIRSETSDSPPAPR